MDYDNFEQMVLGANLTCVKTQEMGELVGQLKNKKCKTTPKILSADC